MGEVKYKGVGIERRPGYLNSTPVVMGTSLPSLRFEIPIDLTLRTWRRGRSRSESRSGLVPEIQYWRLISTYVSV